MALTRDQWRNIATKRLGDAGVMSPALDTRILICHQLGLSHAALIRDGDILLSESNMEQLERLLVRRIAREPVSRIIEKREFYGLDFHISPATLDPRPDSELLIEIALKVQAEKSDNYRILDIGTGSGALLLTLLTLFPNARGIGTDISLDALKVAQYNAENLSVLGRAEFIQTSWAGGITGMFDLIISNPPYIATSDIQFLEPEVCDYEPIAALDGGKDGLYAYREIMKEVPDLLKPTGVLLFEVGHTQTQQVLELMQARGLMDFHNIPAIHTDLAGNPRAVLQMKVGFPKGLPLGCGL